MLKLSVPKWWNAVPIQLGVMLGFNVVACFFNVLLAFDAAIPLLHIVLVCFHGFLATRYWRDLNMIWSVYEDMHGENDNQDGSV